MNFNNNLPKPPSSDFSCYHDYIAKRNKIIKSRQEVPHIDLSSCNNTEISLSKSDMKNPLLISKISLSGNNLSEQKHFLSFDDRAKHIIPSEFSKFPNLDFNNVDLPSLASTNNTSENDVFSSKILYGQEKKPTQKCGNYQSIFSCSPAIKANITPNKNKEDRIEKIISESSFNYYPYSHIPPNAPAPDPIDCEGLTFSSCHNILNETANKSSNNEYIMENGCTELLEN